jgi:hypothetical protein
MVVQSEEKLLLFSLKRFRKIKRKTVSYTDVISARALHIGKTRVENLCMIIV